MVRNRARGPGPAAGDLWPRALRPDALRPALLLLAVFALLLGVLQLAVGLTVPVPFWIPAAFTALFFIWTAAGVIAWWRRPLSGTGGLLLAGAVAIFVGGAGNLGLPILVELNAVFATAILAITVHLLHAFPSGRVKGRFSIVTVTATYGVTLVLEAPPYLLPSDQTVLIAAAGWVQATAGLGVMIATAIFLSRRLRSADPKNVRVLLPLYVYGILAVILIPVSANGLHLIGADDALVGAVQLIILAGIPIAFLIGVLRGGFAQTAAADALSTWLSIGSTKAAVAQALARSLGDESLRVYYWSDSLHDFVDVDGVAVLDREKVVPRLWQEVNVEARLVGAISYDSRMITEPESVRRASRVLAIALDRERLTAALMASNDALQRSLVRTVEAADRERTRIARDLHDGLQVQLVLLAVEAQQIANDHNAHATTSVAATAHRHRIDEAAADLRRLVHAVLPSVLVERGLSAATEDLLDRIDIPATLVSDIDDRALSAATAQSAYLIVSEALTNAVKHSGASAVRVELALGDGLLAVSVSDDGRGGASPENGSGLKGLADRVDALGGTFELVSPVGAGTELRVGLPCGS